VKASGAGRRKWAATSKATECWLLADGRFTQTETSVIIEKELTIYVNGQYIVTASITPAMEQEFVIGHLFGQGFINSPKEIESLEIDEKAAQLRLKDGSRISTRPGGSSYRTLSGGGRMAYAVTAELPKIKSRQKISRQMLFRAMNTLLETASMYRETEGVHAAGLFTTAGNLVCIVEDIGRHNTIDKVIGYAMLNKIDIGETFLVSTGRMTSEMVAKICRAGIPVAATKTAVTDKGWESGKKQGLTIIGFVRDAGTRLNTDMEVRVIDRAGMKIYTGAGRVPCS
jgi:FdhD protein